VNEDPNGSLGSELRRALIGLLLGVAFGALIGLLSRRDRSSRQLA
jgi:ABC-type nitrate/sulfonate/bicarbonate transport system permease component